MQAEAAAVRGERVGALWRADDEIAEYDLFRLDVAGLIEVPPIAIAVRAGAGAAGPFATRPGGVVKGPGSDLGSAFAARVARADEERPPAQIASRVEAVDAEDAGPRRHARAIPRARVRGRRARGHVIGPGSRHPDRGNLDAVGLWWGRGDAGIYVDRQLWRIEAIVRERHPFGRAAARWSGWGRGVGRRRGTRCARRSRGACRARRCGGVRGRWRVARWGRARNRRRCTANRALGLSAARAEQCAGSGERDPRWAPPTPATLPSLPHRASSLAQRAGIDEPLAALSREQRPRDAAAKPARAVGGRRRLASACTFMPCTSAVSSSARGPVSAREAAVPAVTLSLRARRPARWPLTEMAGAAAVDRRDRRG
jgi:hypothetical protein